jgi:hypothetical protein
VYALFALTSALALLCCVRARREPTRARMAAFAFCGSLALLTHYFAVFLLAGMVLWLLLDQRSRRAALGALAALALVGAALVPLVVAQGGHGTQWIERWALSSRLEAIPQYYLTGASGAPLGHGIELLIALPLIAGLALGARSTLGAERAHAAAGALLIAAAGILTPLALALAGSDYLAPRNLLAAMVPLTLAIALVLTAPGAGRAALALAAACAIAFLAVSVDVELSPRLQRGNWRAVARALGRGGTTRTLTTVELGAAPLEYYLGGLRNLPRGSSVTVDEIEEIGYAPLRASAGRAPAPGFSRAGRRDIDGLIVYRFRAAVPRLVSEAALRAHVITLAHPEVLVAARAHVTSAAARG